MNCQTEQGLSLGSTLAAVNNDESMSTAANTRQCTASSSGNTPSVAVEAEVESVGLESAAWGTEPPSSRNECPNSGVCVLLPWSRTYGQALRLSGVPEQGSRKKHEWIYAFSMGILVLGWAGVHFYFVWNNDDNLKGKPDPDYKPQFFVAFLCPQLDGILNVIFAHYVVHRGLRLRVEFCNVLNDVAVDVRPERKGSRKFWWLLTATVFLVALRVFFICQGGLFYLACGFLIEFPPHIPTLLLLERQLHGMGKVLDHLIIVVQEDPGIQIEHLADLYEHFFDFTRSMSRRWQTMIVLSLLLELYSVVFQSIWIRWDHSYKNQHSTFIMLFSLQAIIQTMYMLFKIWPMAAFNSTVAKFPNRVLRATARSESQRQMGQVLAGLFSTGPPTFRILGLTPSWQMIILMVISSLASQFSHYVFDSLNGTTASEPALAS
jgi:hypothetical protein